ncbi:tetratricopeptide repeat protein [Halomicronema sp. CCY15110]|uniref:tetratricopeptide repeat protein n=1 Tax=Halomicronema sp. CCY15110 TaxID=2767773 RepID=UPI0019521EB6|nr:tetratricopeptide repeat protein [Halomicronema sp. CCY15110]
MSLAQSAKQIATDPAAQYQALRRSLRRRKGFGLLFVQASPAQAQQVIQQLQTDLPQKKIGTLTLDGPIDNLYRLIAQRPDLADLNILFIQGIEKSLEPDIKPGYGGEGDYYNLDTVPPLLGHLNQQRDNFRDDFSHLCLVFCVSPFALKYLIKRAADFLDWQSAIFRFPDDSVSSTRATLQPDTDDPSSQAAEQFYIGNGLYEAGRYEEAIAAYDAALNIKPDKDEALYNKGNALSDLGRYEEAIAAYDAALNIKPDKDEALYNKGGALVNLGRYEDAISAYDAALKIKPDYPEALNNKGVALWNLGRYEDAIAAYDAALGIKPDKDEALYNKACCYGLQGQVEPALENLERAIQLSPDEYRELAKTDTDFDTIRADPRFQALMEA